MAPQKDPNFIGSFLLCESINNRAIDSVDNAKALSVNYPAKGLDLTGSLSERFPRMPSKRVVIGNEKYIIFGKMEYIRISNNDASFSVTMVHRFR